MVNWEMFAKSKIRRASISKIYKEFLKPPPKKQPHKNEQRMKRAIFRRGIPKD